MKSAWIIGAVMTAASAHPVAAEPLWAFPNELPGGQEVFFADCGGEEGGECVRMSLGCADGVGRFGVADGGALAARMIETNDLADMAITYTVGAASIAAEASGIDLEPNAMDGGWWASFPSHDMQAVFAVIAEQPAAKIGVSVAGESFDLTPRADGR
ncbi:MAG: hypothetical protein F2813_00275, partial [Actinobacteria bacterium]|nr:hypothetical protein [Actinomycetota bacterium]